MRYATTFILIMSTTVCLSQTHEPRVNTTVNLGIPLEHGIVSSPILNEISGVVASQTNQGILWVHNDSGDQPQIYAISLNGELVCTVRISNAQHRDWEDIAIGKGPDPTLSYLYVGDIGDNGGKSPSIIVYRIPEPTLTPGTSNLTFSAERFEFTYPDGPRDAEGMFVDPLTQDLYIITKRERKGRIYRAAAPLIPSSKVALSFVAELPFTLATSAAISPKGDEVMIKSYVSVYHWRRAGSESIATMFKRQPTTLNYMPEPQGEAICFSASAAGYYTLSEVADTTVDYPVQYYARDKGGPSTFKASASEQQNVTLEPSPDTPGIYVLRYNVPTYSPVRISLVNEAMMEVENIESSTSEQGIQEREIDMIDKPSGTYVVILRTGRRYSAVPLVIKRK